MSDDADISVMKPFLFQIFQTLMEHDDSEIYKEAVLSRRARQWALLNASLANLSIAV